MRVIRETHLPLPLFRQGKVREMYEVGENLMLVASDRISAFDCVLPQSIPDKGAVLTQISAYWFGHTMDLVANHCISADPDEIVDLEPKLAETREIWAGRGMLVRRARPFPIECVVRGYIAGSAWREYRRSGTLAGEPLPAGLVEAVELDPPIFSPATKAEEGHDENITFDQMKRVVGMKVAEHLREVSLDLYRAASRHAREQGVIIADTKFEFGTTSTGELVLIDEALTPDSSRFWPSDDYRPGRTPPSLDKQPVRDYLEGLVDAGEWDGKPPAPELPAEVVASTTARYREAYRRITGGELPDYGD
jgi:phosphoribosylaminoimidazole-succinocarboxamide synthase